MATNGEGAVLDQGREPFYLPTYVLDHTWFLESLDRVERAMRNSDDLEQMLSALLEATRAVFEADRAFASHPLDPDAIELDAPYLAAVPEHQVPTQHRQRVPIPPGYAEDARRTLAASGTVSAGEGLEHPLEPTFAELLHLRSVLQIAVRPKVGKPWSFGLSQCSKPRRWSDEESRLLQEIGRRLGDTLSTLLEHRELEASESRFRALFEQAADPVLLFDDAGLILDANSRVCAQTGRARSELLASSYRDIVTNADGTDTPFWHASAGSGRIVAECRMLTRSGDSLPVEFNATRAVIAERAVIIATARDLSDRQRAEEERKRIESRLHHSQRMEAVGQLAGGVAHDFNNLLTAIQGCLELALHYLPKKKESAAEEMKYALSAVERAAGLTRQLLVFGRRDVAVPRAVDVNQTVDGVGAMLARLLPESVSVRLTLLPGLPPVWVDRGQLEQVIVNLAVNARDAMPGGGVLTIETSAVNVDAVLCASHPEARPGPHVLISVGDTGTGIAPEIADHIFEPFFTTKPVGSGTGLGLATCYAVVKQHNGFIAMYTELGRGTVFKVYLPEHRTGAETSPIHHSPSDLPGGDETILLCEDDPGVRRVTTKTLNEAGYQVLVGENGEAALALSASHSGPIHLLVTDLVMPGMGGQQLSEVLTQARPATRVLYVSGYTANMLAKELHRDATKALLLKPYTRRSLLTAVREALSLADAPGGRPDPT
jgi:two-component system, cell cycle sensor histidine kinase and response regulator CckA